MADDHLQSRLGEEGGPLVAEACERIEADLSKKDRMAIVAAVVKALTKGAELGMAEVAGQISVTDDIPVQVHLHVEGDSSFDLWHEAYGDDRAEGGDGSE